MIDDVGLEPARLLDGLGDGAGLGDDLEALAAVEERDEALADDLVVVDDAAERGRGRSVTGELRSVGTSSVRSDPVAARGR